MNIIDCLEERGLIEAKTSDDLKAITQKPIKLYIGFDPTADSLHLGSLVGIVVLRWFQKFGHTPVVILGGATGRIGDPSGKSTERPLLDSPTIEANIRRIRTHFEQVLDFKDLKTLPLLFNNDDWMGKYPFIDFLRDIGKHFRVNVMLTKDSVKARLEAEEGISFTEFSYQILQAYDFYHLYQSHGVILQAGGSDQWGNITAGTDLIRKLLGETAYGLTFPLLTRSDGKKFGKTEGGAIWLAADRCSPYDLYQYLYRVPDADVIKLMRMLTFMEMEEIRRFEQAMKQPDYIPNSAQKKLAQELTRLLHQEEGLEAALRATQAAAPGHSAELNPAVFHQMMKDMPSVKLAKSEVVDRKFSDIAVQAGLTASKGEAARLITGGGAYLNNERVEDPQLKLTEKHLIGGEFLLLAAGKKKKILVQVS
ncbi:MAG: tyrosine--tRNA ligase [Verrucomicrobia bacterium]|nr:tyrosine--tRNA ligase [Verrucomicrobiota bacterium]